MYPPLQFLVSNGIERDVLRAMPYLAMMSKYRKLSHVVFKCYPVLKQKPYWGNHFWARGYFVSTVCLDEDKIRRYVKYQEKEEKRAEDQQRKFDF